MRAERANEFWRTYRALLAKAVEADPTKFYTAPMVLPEEHAANVAVRIMAVVEVGGFGGINYRESASMRAAAKAVGVPFTRKGLNSLYD
jgi:hypothetical protein